MTLFFLDTLTPLITRVMGEDWTYFSQPRFIAEGGPEVGVTTRFLSGYQLSAAPGFAQPPAQACLARCTEVLQALGQDATDPWMSLLCGGVAGLDPRGRHLCAWHRFEHWHCQNYCCQAVLPHGEGGYCSDACQEEWKDANDV